MTTRIYIQDKEIISFSFRKEGVEGLHPRERVAFGILRDIHTKNVISFFEVYYEIVAIQKDNKK